MPVQPLVGGDPQYASANGSQTASVYGSRDRTCPQTSIHTVRVLRPQ